MNTFIETTFSQETQESQESPVAKDVVAKDVVAKKKSPKKKDIRSDVEAPVDQPTGAKKKSPKKKDITPDVEAPVDQPTGAKKKPPKKSPKTTEKKQCDICCENFSKVRTEVSCLSCKGVVCSQCFMKNLLTEGTTQTCMCCKEELTIEFILINTPKTFFHKYMTRLTDIEISKERILLKATQERQEAYERFKVLQNRIINMSRHLKKFPQDTEGRGIMTGWQRECDELAEIARKDDESIHKTTKTIWCPMLDCSGLVKNGVCGSCKKHICASCREVKEEKHECNKDTVETIKLLAKDTKGCPKCSTPIHKIDGCDQMFCIKCKTAFSWNSGKIVTGVIHNPHYFAWLRTAGQHAELERLNANANNIGVCGHDVTQAVNNIFNHDRDDVLQIAIKSQKKDIVSYDFVPRVLGETQVILTDLNDKVHNTETILRENTKLRERFLAQKKAKNLTVEKAERNWYNQLRLRFKRRVMMRELITIIDAFDQVLKETIIRADNDKNYEKMLITIDSATNFLKEQVESHKQRHGIDNFTEISFYSGLFCGLSEI